MRYVPVLVVMLCGLGGCASLPTGQSWHRAGAAALDAARDPWVWAPLAGAAALQVGNADHRISRWARTEAPLFGSNDEANRMSDRLRSVAVIADAVVVLSEPRRNGSANWAEEKAVQYVEDLVAATTAISMTRALKSASGRVRPMGQDAESFPSGHVTIASAYDRLAAQRLQRFDLDPALKMGLGLGFDAITVGTAWARIEAGAHYPSDTLAGMALGAFSARFFEGFLRGGEGPRISIGLMPERGGARMAWRAAW